jgi:exo-beta-1,3-glucanase (GH17 family)
MMVPTRSRSGARLAGVVLTVFVATGCARTDSDQRGAPEVLRLSPRGVAYAPRGYDPFGEHSVPPEQVEEDLRTLREVGFRSVATYGSDGVLGAVPAIARRAGFDGLVVMGIWDPRSEAEITNAVDAAPYVDAYCVGNEGMDVRYAQADLEATMGRLRLATRYPVTTSERIGDYVAGPHREWLVAQSDWFFPTAHPYWYGHRDVRDAVRWITTHYDVLAASGGRPVILKEASFPTSGEVDGGEERQVQLFMDLERAGIPFFYFEAYDQEWKRSHPDYTPDDAHWGLFHADGSPKKVIAWITAHPPS